MKNLTVILSVIFSMLTVVANAQTQTAENGTNWFAIILLGMVLVVPPVMYAIARAGKVYAKIKDAVREYREKKQRAEEAKYELAGLRGKLRSEFATLENYARAKKMSPQRKAEMDSRISKIRTLVEELPGLQAKLTELEDKMPELEENLKKQKKNLKNAEDKDNATLIKAGQDEVNKTKEIQRVALDLIEKQKETMQNKRALIAENISLLSDIKDAIELGEDYDKIAEKSDETNNDIFGIVSKMSDDLNADTTAQDLAETKDRKEKLQKSRSNKK